MSGSFGVPDHANNPFKGLAYFGNNRADHRSFGGRDRDIAAVTSAILRSRAYVIYGRSGLGKTSLFLAGVFPEIKLHGCYPIYVRTLLDPLRDLRSALLAHSDQEEGDDDKDLHQLIAEIAGRGATIALVFDQFEEFFLRFSNQTASGESLQKRKDNAADRRERSRKKREFISAMGKLVSDRSLDLRLIFSLREDWFADMKDFEVAIPDILKRSYRLAPLSAFGVRQSILQTLKAKRVPFDKRLISGLVDKLEDYNYDPAVLQVTCSEVWRQAKARDPDAIYLRAADLEEVGGIDGIFRRYLGRVEQEIPKDDISFRVRARAVLASMITGGRTKRAVPKSYLLERSFVIDGPQLNQVLELLTRNRLVRPDRRGGEEWFELIHERLIAWIPAWLDSDTEYYDFRGGRNLVAQLSRNPGWRENPGLLMSGDQLEGALGRFKELLRFEKEELLFLVSSAINAGSKDLDFWAAEAGEDATVKRLDALLDQDADQEARGRAASAAGELGLAPRHFAARCRDLALDHEDESVRRSAARAFAKIASVDDYEPIVTQLNQRASRQNAVGVLAEGYGLGLLPTDLKLKGRRLRWVRNHFYKLRLPEGLQALRERGRRGAVAGFQAGLVWSLTALPLAIWITVREVGNLEEIGEPFRPWLSLWIVCLLVLVPLGALAGLMVSRRAAIEALFTGREGAAFRALLSRKILKLAVLVLVAGAVAYMDWPLPLSLGSAFTLGVLTVLATYLAVVSLCALAWLGLIATMYRSIASTPWRRFPWMRSWIWALGATMAPAVMLWLGQSVAPVWLFELALQTTPPLSSTEARDFAIALVAVLLIGGQWLFAGLVSLTRGSPGWRPELDDRLHLGRVAHAKPKLPRQVLEVVGPAMLLASLLLLFVSNRFDSVIPQSLKLRDLDHQVAAAADQQTSSAVEERAPTSAVIALGRGPLDTAFVNMKVARQQPPLKPRLAKLVFADVTLRSKDISLNSGDTVIVPSGNTLLGVRKHPSISAPVLNLGVTTDLRDEATLPTSGGFVVATLARANSMWTGRVERNVEVGSLTDPVVSVDVGETVYSGEGCEKDNLVLDLVDPGKAVYANCTHSAASVSFSEPIELDVNEGRVQIGINASGYRPIETLEIGGTATAAAFGPIQKLTPGEREDELRRRREASGDPRRASRKRGLLLSSNEASAGVWSPGGRFTRIDSINTNAVSWSDSGEWFATGADQLAKIFRFDSYEQLDPAAELTFPHANAVQDVDLNSDGTQLVTASLGIAAIWENQGLGLGERPAAVKPLILRHDQAKGEVWKARFSDDGKRVATAASDGAYVWRTDGSQLAKYPQNEAVYWVDWGWDDRFLLTACADGSLRVYDVGRLDGQVLEPVTEVETEEGLYSAIFANDGRVIVAAGDEGTLSVFDVEIDEEGGLDLKEKAVAELKLPTAQWSVVAEPSGSLLATTGADGIVSLWDLNQLRKSNEEPVFVFLRFGNVRERGEEDPLELEAAY